MVIYQQAKTTNFFSIYVMNTVQKSLATPAFFIFFFQGKWVHC